MTSRNAIQQQNRGDAVPEVHTPKKVGTERKNRRALGDIGNLVTCDGDVDDKQIPQISRCVTSWGFGAQLLANAQAAAAAVKKAISGVALEKKSAEKSVKKKNAPTFSSSLTARSKAACGMNQNDQIVDIDAADVDNELAAVEYVEDLYKYYKSAEGEGRVHDYMASQPEINVKMRAILVDWLVCLHCKFELSQETLYLTITLVDRYLAATTTSIRELQLVGLGALLIASKFEERWQPEVNDLVNMSDRTYTNQQVLVMEKLILGQLEWQLTFPTAYVFLARFIKASMTGSIVENMVFYFAELGMMNYETIIHHCPSMLAASAVYTARRTLNKTPFWTATLKAYTGFSEEQLIDCAKQLVSFHSNVVGDQKLTGSYKKYSKKKRGAVSLHLPPAKSLLLLINRDVSSTN